MKKIFLLLSAAVMTVCDVRHRVISKLDITDTESLYLMPSAHGGAKAMSCLK